MKLSAEELPRHLAKGLAPLYVIHGEALLLSIEAADAIRAAARAAGYDERGIDCRARFQMGRVAQ